MHCGYNQRLLLCSLGMPSFGMVVNGFGALIFGITESSARLSLTPERLQESVSKPVRLLVWGRCHLVASLEDIYRNTFWVAYVPGNCGSLGVSISTL